MKEFNFSSNKQKIFVILLIILANSLMVFIFIKSMFNVFKLPVTSTITTKEFTTELEKMNCKVINQKINNKNRGVNIYLSTDKTSCPYLVSYITFNDEETKLNVVHDFTNEVLNKNENLKIKNTINILDKYIEYNSTGNNYKAFTMYKNSILYGSTSKKYKKEMINIFNKFQYHYVPNARNLKQLNYILVIYALIVLVSYYKIEKKCGKKGWIIFIPFYNFYDLFKKFLENGWLSLTIYIPFINVVSLFILNYYIAKSFSKNEGICVLNMLLPNIFLPMIAFDDSKYTKTQFSLRKAKPVIKSELTKVKQEPKKKEKPKIKLSIILKWILAIILFLFGFLMIMAYIDDEFKWGGILFGLLLIIYGLMVCPSISKYTKKYSKYNKYKKVIIGLLILINFIILLTLDF